MTLLRRLGCRISGSGRSSRLALVAVSALVVAGCGGTSNDVSVGDAGVTAAALAGVKDAECFRLEGDRFECVITSPRGARIVGTLTCDDGRCLWRPNG